MPSFSDHAHFKMMDLFNNHSHEVGSQVASRYPGKTPTDCITYIINVLKYAFEQVGDKGTAERIVKLGQRGTKLAAFLANSHRWKGIYYNPDINHPRDGDLEHPYSYYKKAALSGQYFEIPISYWVINFNPTPSLHPSYKTFSGIGGSKDASTKDDSQLERLTKVKFAVGVSRGGKHTWLYSLGKVYEVHWDKVGAELYGASDFESYPWISGALVVPPDALATAKFDEGKSTWRRFLESLGR